MDRCGEVGFGKATQAWLGWVWQGEVRLVRHRRRGAVRFGLVRRGLAWQARRGKVRSVPVRTGIAGTAWLGQVWRGAVRHRRQR